MIQKQWKRTGAPVRAAQGVLNSFGFTDRMGNRLKEDGVLGSKTKEAFGKFKRYQDEMEKPSRATMERQAALNKSGHKYLDGQALKVDGVWGPKTDHVQNAADNAFTGPLMDADYSDRTLAKRTFPKMPRIPRGEVDKFVNGEWANLGGAENTTGGTHGAYGSGAGKAPIGSGQWEGKTLEQPRSIKGFTGKDEDDIATLRKMVEAAAKEEKGKAGAKGYMPGGAHSAYGNAMDIIKAAKDAAGSEYKPSGQGQWGGGAFGEKTPERPIAKGFTGKDENDIATLRRMIEEAAKDKESGTHGAYGIGAGGNTVGSGQWGGKALPIAKFTGKDEDDVATLRRMIEAAAGTKKGGTQPGNMVYNMRNGDSDKVKLLSDPVAQPTQPPQGNAGGTAVDWGQAWNAEPQAGPSKGAEMPGAGAAGSGPAPGRQNPGGMANTTLPVFKTREELREYLKQHPEARINGIDGQMLDDMEKKYGLGSPRNNEMLTNPTETIDIHDTPGHMPLTDLLKLSDEELDRMGVDRSQLDNARAQQGMQDVEKAHYDEIAKEAASQDGTRNPEREKKANEMLENVNISLPGDRILSGHSENGKPVIDGPIPITSEQRIQNVLESPQFISEDWDEIRPLDNDMLVPLGMLGQSIYGGGERLSPEGAKILSHEVAANPVFRDDVEKLIAENSNNSSFDTGEEQKNFSNAGRSLGLSLGNATVRIKGTKMKDGSWMIEFGGKDAYDYSEWKKGSTLADTANNWAYLNQGMGMIKPYPVRFSGAFVYPAK